MPVAEIFVSAFITVLFEKLASGELLNFARREGIHSQMTSWEKMLLEIQAVLTDAEDKQIKDKAVGLWLDDLQDLAYDLDDILDEFATEALRRKLTAESQPSTSKVRAFLPSCCTSFTPRYIKFNSLMMSKIEEISNRFESINKRRNELHLENVSGGTSATTWQRPATTSLIQDPCIYGREADKTKIIEFLLRDESGDNKLGVIPIVGMGGVGKTTLAQKVYNDEKVKEHFDLKAWVCVSDVFDLMRITKAILEYVTSQSCDFEELAKVQVELKKNLDGKKFLIVLDDVWNKKYNDWNALKSPFNDGAQGSKVMVTTRNTDVAKMMRTVNYYDLGCLSHADCWSVFAQHAFKNRSIDDNPTLVSIGRSIVEKCGGLPLAARTLGGLLQCKESENEWDDVLKSKIWDLSDEVSDILPALRLSYRHLPSHLKQCFAYCSILPKDYEFEEEELVLLWMAEGFIRQPKGEKQMEDLGSEYFHEILSRSFFQPSSSGNSSQFVMHDLINDLAQSVARDTCFRLEDLLKDQEQYKNLNKARHSSYMRGYYDGMKKFEIFDKAKHLRTFLPFSLRTERNCYLTNNVPFNLLPKLRYSRVLSLRRYQISELPNSIGDLKHLRYLNLSYTDIRKLPKSIGTLYNLQTLMLIGCKCLKKLPTDIGNLINLRCLDITGAHSLNEMPLGIGKLASLQMLSNFIVIKDGGIQIRELGNLIHLRGTLCISGLQNVVDPLDARRVGLQDKKGLDVLSLVWSESLDDLLNARVETEVLDMLRPHEKLKELYIRCYHGTRFPTWIGDPLFSNMEHISLKNCRNCTSLPPLGQLPLLKVLYIEGISAIKNVGCEFYGHDGTKPFPLLETLSIVNMPEWEDWYTFGGDKEVQPFARVSKLSIRECPKLLGTLPSDLPSLKTLDITNCPLLQVEVSSLVLPSLSSLYMGDVPLPSLQMLLEMRNTLESSSLASLHLGDFSIPDSLCNPSVADEERLANAVYKHLSSVTSCSIANIQKLAFLPKWITRGLMTLEELKIEECEELTTLWQNEVRLQHCLPAFRCLEIENCPQLVSLFEKEEGEENEGQPQQLEEEHDGLPCIVNRLEYLKIDNCEQLKKLHALRSLEELIIERCSSVISFPETGYPSTLRKLQIINCEALKSLSGWITQNTTLEEFCVYDCPSLTYLMSCSGGLPTTLKCLKIWNCKKLEALLVEEEMKINCPSLQSIEIMDCRSLRYLPDALHNNNNNLRNLSELTINKCGNLESLPEGWFSLATNLRKLEIKDCQKLETLPPLSDNNLTSLQRLKFGSCPAVGVIVSCLPDRGHFLINLTSLSISNMKIDKPGFHRFSSLTTLHLEGPMNVAAEEEHSSVSSFPVDGMSLPNSLIELRIWNFPNLETLSSKEFQNLSSLQELWIEKCPRLASFPKEGLPPSLLELHIYHCPILKEQCEKGKGGSIIAHIPYVSIY